MQKITTLEDANKSETGPMINELLRVRLPVEAHPGNYHSRIEDIVEKKLVLTWPAEDGVRLPVHVDHMLSFSMVRDGGTYFFSGLVDKIAGEPQPLVTIIVASSVENILRRQGFRVKHLIPLEVFAPPPETSDELPRDALHLKTATYDLSASGVSLRTPKQIPDGTLLNVKISLPDGGPVIETSCIVAHCFAPPENPNKFHIGIQFLKIENNDMARIVRFIYRSQLKEIKE